MSLIPSLFFIESRSMSCFGTNKNNFQLFQEKSPTAWAASATRHKYDSLPAILPCASRGQRNSGTRTIEFTKERSDPRTRRVKKERVGEISFHYFCAFFAFRVERSKNKWNSYNRVHQTAPNASSRQTSSRSWLAESTPSEPYILSSPLRFDGTIFLRRCVLPGPFN